MKYCKKCLQPNTRPYIKFDKKGICFPCNYFKSLNSKIWKDRQEKIKEIANWCKKNKSTSGYDCIISASGGKDSTRLALICRDKLKLNPLLVSTVSPPEMTTKIGYENIDNLNRLGFDIITIEPDPIIYKKLMKHSFIEYGNYAKSTELALYASAPRVAIAYGIKMIFLGENNSLVYGEKEGSKDQGNAIGMINYNTLGSGDISWMTKSDYKIKKKDLIPYIYPSKKALIKNGINIRYLGYYFKDFNNYNNARVAIKNGLRIRKDNPKSLGALTNYDALDDDFVVVNQMIKYFKFGFGKSTDEACEMIRLGILTRKKAKKIVFKTDGECSPKYIDDFCKYLGITKKRFYLIVDKYRSKNLWVRNGKKWRRTFDLMNS